MRGVAVDVVVMFVAGIIAFFLRRSGYSVAGIVLGVILGKKRWAPGFGQKTRSVK